MLLTSVFSKENSAISLEEWVLVFKVFTTAKMKLIVNHMHACFCFFFFVCFCFLFLFVCLFVCLFVLAGLLTS